MVVVIVVVAVVVAAVVGLNGDLIRNAEMSWVCYFLASLRLLKNDNCVCFHQQFVAVYQGIDWPVLGVNDRYLSPDGVVGRNYKGQWRTGFPNIDILGRHPKQHSNIVPFLNTH